MNIDRMAQIIIFFIMVLLFIACSSTLYFLYEATKFTTNFLFTNGGHVNYDNIHNGIKNFKNAINTN